MFYMINFVSTYCKVKKIIQNYGILTALKKVNSYFLVLEKKNKHKKTIKKFNYIYDEQIIGGKKYYEKKVCFNEIFIKKSDFSNSVNRMKFCT